MTLLVAVTTDVLTALSDDGNDGSAQLLPRRLCCMLGLWVTEDYIVCWEYRRLCWKCEVYVCTEDHVKTHLTALNITLDGGETSENV